MVLATPLTTSIDQVSAAGRIAYTERQLYYEVCRTLQPGVGLSDPRTLVVLAMSQLPALVGERQPRWVRRLAMGNVLAVAALSCARFVPHTRSLPVGYSEFHTALTAYRQRHGEPAGLLPPAAALVLQPPASEPDLHDYGLERVLLCQHQEIAAMLRANWLHMEAKCAIFSVAEGLPSPVRAMLERTPGAVVSLLHDASAEGLALAAQVRERCAVPADRRVIAVGLRPTQAQRLHLYSQRQASASAAAHPWPAYLTAREQAWLRQHWCAEVAAVHPARLLNRLRRILTGNVPTPWRPFSLQRDRDIGFMTWPEA